MPQFAAPASQLPGQFQSLLDNPKIRTPKVPWTLSKQEKKDYDQIFRAWDVSGEGFISGEMAREVFGQSGLGQNDLIKIWYVPFDWFMGKRTGMEQERGQRGQSRGARALADVIRPTESPISQTGTSPTCTTGASSTCPSSTSPWASSTAVSLRISRFPPLPEKR